MATKKGKQVRGFWSNYKRLPLIFFLYITLCLISTPSSAWAAYIYTELLPLGWSQVYAESINDKGDVVGWGQAGTMQKGFLYSGGVYTELLPPGYDSAYPTGINDKRDVIGWADVIGVGTGCFIATSFRGE